MVNELRRFFRRLRRPFLNKEELAAIVSAIEGAETRSSGEIHVHVTARCPGDPLAKARELFASLGLEKTKRRNGVLILVSHLDHKIAIWGDAGIHEKAGQQLWEAETATLRKHFQKNLHAQGLIAAVEDVGRVLAQNFPPEGGDSDELPNQVSGH